MLHCKVNMYVNPQGETMTFDFESLKERLREMFPNQYKSDVEQYINSKNPSNGAEVEYWIQQWNYSNQKYLGL
jgi:hypothetical protein